ncbi:hypothetical protein SON66_11845 [Pseudomonas syringae]|uniref:hypothetical protein n=1 Tax=Pseudomonas syringae TaxID=317 RepID=UPI000428FC0E|nr:hypothetical protein [Pseudomonas syringae]MDY2563961.1 hypothetical protein [Pseudomonas syringae]
MNFKKSLIFTCLLFSQIILADEVGENIVAPLVEDDLRQAKADIRAYERNIKILDDLLEKIQNAQLQKTPKGTISESNWKKGKAIVESFKGNEVNQEKYRQALVFLSQSLEGAMDVKGNFWSRSTLDFYFERDSAVDSGYLKAARTAASDVMAKYSEAFKSKSGPVGLIFEGRSPTGRMFIDEREDIDENELDANISELKLLISKDYDSIYSSIQDGYFEAIVNGKIAAELALKNIRTQEKESLNDKRKALSSFILEFKKLEKQDEARRESTDIRLVYAVYGMIGVLLFLFLGLKVFSDDVAKSLIVNRSLVEVVGMAFMLITIIILGTGEKLSKEILGTLLGTIAGYVFARGTEDARASRKTSNSNDDI